MSYTDDDYEADIELETDDYCTTDGSAIGDKDQGIKKWNIIRTLNYEWATYILIVTLYSHSGNYVYFKWIW